MGPQFVKNALTASGQDQPHTSLGGLDEECGVTQVDIVGTWIDGPETYVSGIQGSASAVIAGEIRYYTASGGETGGILSWHPERQNGRSMDADPLIDSAALGDETGLEIVNLNGRDALLVHGLAGAAVTGHWINGNGTLSDGFRMASGSGSLRSLVAVARGGEAFFYSTERGDAAVTIWQLGADNLLTATGQVSLGNDISDGALVAMAHAHLEGQDMLLVARSDVPELICLRIAANGTVQEVDRIGAPDGLQIATATALNTVTLQGETYVLMTAAGTGSVSVVGLAASGEMSVTDQVNDDLSTRFQSVETLQTVVLDGQAFVVVGGGDDGISIMQLLPGGRLLHRATLADQTTTTLANVSSLSAVAVNGWIEIFATSESEPGVTHLRFAPGPLGETLMAKTSGGGLNGTGVADVLVGSDEADQIRALDGDDILIDGAGADQLWGGSGADVFVLMADGASDRVMDFEPGVDRLDLSDFGRAYDLSAFALTTTNTGIRIRFGDETVTLVSDDRAPIDSEDLGIGDLIDLWHIAPYTAPAPPDMPADPRHAAAETILGSSGDDILFGDQEDSTFDPVAAQVYRLYQATLGRAPEATGLVNWTERLIDGMTLNDAAVGFVGSREFQNSYGDTTDTEFVTLLYQNVLDRDPDSSGLGFWTGHLERGSLSRSEVVTSFSQSLEFIKNTATEVLGVSRAGMLAQSNDVVYRLYLATLGREPEETGFSGWSGRLARGMTLDDAATGFVESREFQNSYGDTTDTEFVTLLYRNVLDRDPDSSGLGFWTGHLDRGSLSRSEVVTRFSSSVEFVRNTEDDVVDYIQAFGTDDRLIGGSGDDLLFGAGLSDVFVFDATQSGADQVVGFEIWDRIELSGFGYQIASEAMAHLQEEDGCVTFSDQGVHVTFCGATIDQFSAETFWLS